MSQLSLNISPCLAYSPSNFLMHKGISGVFEGCMTLLATKGFRICFIVGGSRCGKTHFSIKLTDTLIERGYTPRLIEGGQCFEWIRQHLDYSFLPEDVVVIDDADRYLEKLKPGDSGELVAFIEKLRLKGAALVMLSSKQLSQFEFDAHARSRLLPGTGFEIESPAAEDMAEIVRAMAKQRGLSLSSRKVSYVEKRIGRDIPAVESYLERLNSLSRLLGKPIKFSLIGDAI